MILSKAAYGYIYGVYISPHSDTWFTGWDALSPPFYPWLLRSVISDEVSLWIWIGFQILFYSFAFTLLAVTVLNSRRLLFVFACFACLDPNTAHFAFALSPEILFLSFTALSLALFHHYLRTPSPELLSLFIFFTALAFLVHFQALILPFGCLIYLLFFPLHRRYFWKTALIFVFGFQLVLFPVRLVNKQHYDTWRINALTGYSLWNNASILYCNSILRVNPRNEFETFIAYKPCGDYTQEKSLQGWHIANAASSLQQFVRKHKIAGAELIYFSDNLFRSALSIIIQHPLDYLNRFVLPNIQQVFLFDEIRESVPLTDKYRGKSILGNITPAYMYFNRYLAWIMGGLMVFNLLFQAYYHRSLGFLSILNLGYFLTVSLMGPVRCGDFLVITPFILFNVVFLWDKLFYRNTYFRFAYRGL
jgi:hypothetical protein